MILNATFSDDLACSLAKRLLTEYKDRPFDLAKIQVIMPTKRAVKTLKDAFKKLTSNNATLLPKLVALYELEALNPDIPPAIDPTERLILLAKLCQAKPNVQTFDMAIKIAASLTELLDLSYQFDLNLSGLESLVPIEKFAEHWQQTVQFLDILSTYWPQVLAERHQIDPMDQEIRLIRSFTQHLSSIESPLVLAGFDGAFPALQELIVQAQKNPKNWIILDGYHDSQNQTFGIALKNLYEALSKPQMSLLNPVETPQESLGIQALSNDTWNPSGLKQDSLKNIHLIVADTVQSEALTIALILRNVLETPQKTASLVTTDRTLARQVITQMKRWGVQLDDSAGTPLNHTPVGIFLQLLTDLAIHPDGQHYLALLKSPLSADHQNPNQFRQYVKRAEYLARKDQKKCRFNLQTNLSEWLDLFANNVLTPFTQILTTHIHVAESLATSHDRPGKQRLWSDEAGSKALELLNKLMSFGDIIGNIEPATYSEILKMLMQQTNVRPKYGMHPRLDVLGPIEARFHHTDVCVIGGLNEGIFPPLPETGPWLNCTMRKQLGLPAPEQKTDELAMDFLHSFCAPEVYLTRSKKVDGAPSIPSRFIERLKAVAEINSLVFPETTANLAKLIDTPKTVQRIQRPIPKPPVDVRPKKLSVTRVELWRRNPYAIYARYILSLFPLTPLECINKAAAFGSLVHKILEVFFQKNPKSTDIDPLLDLGKQMFDSSDLSEGDKIFFWPKFEKIANFIIQMQIDLVPVLDDIILESTAEMELDVDGYPFVLTGTADRINVFNNGSLGIVDFKTQNATPKKNEVLAGYSPQLTLEALLAENNGFKTGHKKVTDLSYWSLTGSESGGKVVSINKTVDDVATLITQARDGLIEMIRTFNDPNTPYEVCPIPSKAPTYNDYEHLARSKEWDVDKEDS